MTTRNRISETYTDVQNILNGGGHISVSQNVGHFALNVYGDIAEELTQLLYAIEFNICFAIIIISKQTRKHYDTYGIFKRTF